MELWQAYFVNDDWKVTPSLTLNLGLRYDYFQPYKQSDDKFVNIEQNGFIVAGLTDAKDSRLRARPDRAGPNNWAPRFGFAWRPAFVSDTVVRGGYGIYYTPQISNAIFAMAEGAQATAGRHRRSAIPPARRIVLHRPVRRRGHQRRAELRRSQRPELARQLHPAVELQRAEETARQFRAGRRLCGPRARA